MLLAAAECYQHFVSLTFSGFLDLCWALHATHALTTIRKILEENCM